MYMKNYSSAENSTFETNQLKVDLRQFLSLRANEVCHHIEAYIGDLLHDGFTLAHAREGETYLWTIKGNRCGTWLHLCSNDYAFQNQLIKESAAAYFLTVTQVLEVQESGRQHKRIFGTVSICDSCQGKLTALTN